jgi:hypothetical protein
MLQLLLLTSCRSDARLLLHRMRGATKAHHATPEVKHTNEPESSASGRAATMMANVVSLEDFQLSLYIQKGNTSEPLFLAHLSPRDEIGAILVSGSKLIVEKSGAKCCTRDLQTGSKRVYVHCNDDMAKMWLTNRVHKARGNFYQRPSALGDVLEDYWSARVCTMALNDFFSLMAKRGAMFPNGKTPVWVHWLPVEADDTALLSKMTRAEHTELMVLCSHHFTVALNQRTPKTLKLLEDETRRAVTSFFNEQREKTAPIVKKGRGYTVGIHYRCGDLLFGGKYNERTENKLAVPDIHRMVKFDWYAQLIPRHAANILIIGQYNTSNARDGEAVINDQKSRSGSNWNMGECTTVVVAFLQFLQKQFPSAKVSLASVGLNEDWAAFLDADLFLGSVSRLTLAVAAARNRKPSFLPTNSFTPCEEGRAPGIRWAPGLLMPMGMRVSQGFNTPGDVRYGNVTLGKYIEALTVSADADLSSCSK